jgi:N-acetyl-gamma-glutamylphosphate reductase
MVRGIHVTAQCLIPQGWEPARVADLIEERYQDEPFVRLVNRPPRVATVAGTNFAELGYVVHERQLAVCCALDNLGKGMAGQAVQCMNLALGIDETTGLLEPAIYP